MWKCEELRIAKLILKNKTKFERFAPLKWKIRYKGQ